MSAFGHVQVNPKRVKEKRRNKNRVLLDTVPQAHTIEHETNQLSSPWKFLTKTNHRSPIQPPPPPPSPEPPEAIQALQACPAARCGPEMALRLEAGRNERQPEQHIRPLSNKKYRTSCAKKPLPWTKVCVCVCVCFLLFCFLFLIKKSTDHPLPRRLHLADFRPGPRRTLHNLHSMPFRRKHFGDRAHSGNLWWKTFLWERAQWPNGHSLSVSLSKHVQTQTQGPSG